ncbi:hypothetical protein LOTGIDRAFT_234459 [Lottia gigantea]|uniref:Uncharacterized protein n=1 Tax=Lottia gigantea TaxID=225164 RepID=V3ZBY4_LOTGI|nr:hypothetical protein LOTGIDRAFT_234459 [Lottia gigantea]ESO88548.1 hypothetical protein LOTGIDRAFT_234459 [Lottia gigantea]
MTSEVGNSVSWPDYEETSEEYSNRFQNNLDRWKTRDSLLEVPQVYQEYDFDATLEYWKDHDSKRRRAKAPHRHSIHRRKSSVKSDAHGLGAPLSHQVVEVLHDHESHQYSSESPCEYIPQALPLHRSDEEFYDGDFEEFQEEQTRFKWNWIRAVIVGGVTLAGAIGIPIAYQYVMVYYYPEEEDCNCINDGLWKFVTRTLFNMREPVRKPFLGFL